MITEDLYEKTAREIREAAARNEAARKSNVELFVKMFLGLGVDAIKVAGSGYDAELAEARGLAGHRWSKLLDADAQTVRGEQNLAMRPKKRPSQPGDNMLATEVIDRLNKVWEQEAEDARRHYNC